MKSRTLFILLLSLICIGSSPVFPEVDGAHAQQRDSNLRSPRLIEQGKRAYLEGHFLIARSLFRKASAADPQNALAHYGYARSAVVVLNYWATWSAPCIAEFPQFQKLVKEYANQPDVIFLAVAVDDDPQQVKTWLKDKDYDFNVLLDQKTAINYKVNSYPTAFILAPNGSIAYRTTGFPGNARYLKEMRLRIEALRSK